MHKYITIFMIAISLIIVSTAANAFDYKNWIPLLPESIGGIEKHGDPSGMNMEKSGQSWSLLRQKYSGIISAFPLSPVQTPRESENLKPCSNSTWKPLRKI